MDKTDILWYNLDMNNIVFSGYFAEEEKKLHSHKGYEIKLCSCAGKIETDTESYQFGEDDFVVVPLLLKHKHFGGEQSLTIILEQALLPIKDVTIIQSSTAYGLKETFLQANYYFHKQADSGNILASLGDLIAAYLTTYSGNKNFSPVVVTVMAEIDKNLSNAGFSLDNFMHTLPLNYDYVRKLFKKEVDLTPHDYLTNSRMELAKSIITSGVSNQYSSYTITQIAEMCGFSEPLYFSRVFKKHFGVSPSDYNKQR
jgi:AraC-like DNA-binding protein